MVYELLVSTIFMCGLLWCYFFVVFACCTVVHVAFVFARSSFFFRFSASGKLLVEKPRAPGFRPAFHVPFHVLAHESLGPLSHEFLVSRRLRGLDRAGKT